MENPNSKTVFVIQADKNKDFSDARRFGTLRAVFNNPRKPYDTSAMIDRAKRVLRDWKPGDYLLMIGDPTLCAVCMTLVTEEYDQVNVSRSQLSTFT